MNILFTGASSFTGVWFVRELAEAGFNVTATFRRGRHDYQGLRRKRVEIALRYCRPLFNCSFGDESFLKAVTEAPGFTLLCHHGAESSNYKSPNFDFAAALNNNCRNIDLVIKTMKEKGLKKIMLTGSVFEQNEGRGTEPLAAFSPYGLSKGLTADSFIFFAAKWQLKLAKFVIPNPFGPYEEPRFTSYLAGSWLKGERPRVCCPSYIRDNIPVRLLARGYLSFARALSDHPGFERFNPGWLRGSQAEFTRVFAEKLRKRLNVPCEFELGEQSDFSEPLERVNFDTLDAKLLGWNEDEDWDRLAEYYLTAYGSLR